WPSCVLLNRESLPSGGGGQRPSSRFAFFLSAPTTSAGRPRRRVRFDGFFSSRCERYCFRRNTLPVPVTLKRFAAPRWVFIFGMSGSVVVGRGAVVLRLASVPLGWVQHHGHVPAVLAR